MWVVFLNLGHTIDVLFMFDYYFQIEPPLTCFGMASKGNQRAPHQRERTTWGLFDRRSGLLLEELAILDSPVPAPHGGDDCAGHDSR